MPIRKARLKISDYNQNRKTKLRAQEGRVRMVSLSLTSMVDMFAILVIFLLANFTTASEWLKFSHGIDLPLAKSNETPQLAPVIEVARDLVYLNDKPVFTTAAASLSGEALRKRLAGLDKKRGTINIVAHTRLPFVVIKKVIGACHDAGFPNVNLAVRPRT